MPFHRIHGLIFIGILWVIVSCHRKDHRLSPSVISLDHWQDASEEATVRKRLLVTLDHPQPTDTYLHFRVSGTAQEKNHTRFGVPDYHILMRSPLVIPAGNTTYPIAFDILEDSLPEPEEHFVLEITAVGRGNAVLHTLAARRTHKHYIVEKEMRPYFEQEGDFIKTDDMLVRDNQPSESHSLKPF